MLYGLTVLLALWRQHLHMHTNVANALKLLSLNVFMADYCTFNCQEINKPNTNSLYQDLLISLMNICRLKAFKKALQSALAGFFEVEETCKKKENLIKTVLFAAAVFLTLITRSNLWQCSLSMGFSSRSSAVVLFKRKYSTQDSGLPGRERTTNTNSKSKPKMHF